MTKKLAAILLSVALLFICIPADAQSIQSSTATVTLNLTVGETLTVSTGAVTSANFAPTTGFNYATPTIPVSVTYSLLTSRSSLAVCEYLIQNTLPADGTTFNNAYMSSVDGGATQNFASTGSSTCNGSFNVAGYVGQDVYDKTFSGGNTVGSHTDNVVVSTNFTTAIAPGSYSGSIVFVAQAN